MHFSDCWSERGNSAEALGSLVQSHYELVKLVRATEEVFSSTLQAYYATNVNTYMML